jgi:REP element-mobilizing transposase RayT
MMARPLRLEHDGALWHVTSRGNERRSIFREEGDRSLFLSKLAETVEIFAWRLHAYVLMGNHYHLLMETPEPNLSRGMHRLNATYSQKFNRCHERVGHLFQGRFKGILVEKESHLLELVRYVVLNPVRAGLVSDPGAWRWSNYRATAGLEAAPSWLDTQWTISQFGGRADGRRSYRQFVAAGIGAIEAPWSRLEGQIFLGGDDFKDRLRRRMELTMISREVPRHQTTPTRPALSSVVEAAASVLRVQVAEVRRQRRSRLRLVVAYIARTDGLVKHSDLGAMLQVTATSACEIASAAGRLSRCEPEFRELIRKVRAEIRRMKT